MRAAVFMLFAGVALGASGNSHWDYTNPMNWVEVDHQCAGEEQSPIDVQIDESMQSSPSFLKLFVPRVNLQTLKLHTKGHNIQLDLAKLNITLTTSTLGLQYSLLQVHYHTPSEHTINGKRYPLERHMVFLPSDYKRVLTSSVN